MADLSPRRERYRQFSIVAYVVMLALLVPLTVFVVEKEQDVRSRASQATLLAADEEQKDDTTNGTTDPNFQTLGPCNDPAQCPDPSVAQISGGPVIPSTVIEPVDANNNAPGNAPCENGARGGDDENGNEDGGNDDEDNDEDKGGGDDDEEKDGDEDEGDKDEDNEEDDDENNEEEENEDQNSPSPAAASLASDDDDDDDNKSKDDDDDSEDDDDNDEDDDKKGKHTKKDGGVSGIGEALVKVIIELLKLILQVLGGGQIDLPNQDGGDNGDQQPCPPADNPDDNPVDNPVDNPNAAPSGGAAPSQGMAPSGAAPSGAPAPSGTQSQVPVGSKVVFDGSYDNGGFSSWGSCQWNGNNGDCPAQGQPPMGAIVNDGPGHETAARYEIRPGDTAAEGNRTEARAPKVANVVEGDERWYQFSLKFDQNFKNPGGGWFIVMQWHSSSGSPPLALEVTKSGVLELTSSVGNKSLEIGPITKGQWVDYVIHAKFSNNSSAGFVEVFENGALKLKKTNMANMSSSSNYLKMGIYRDDGDTGNNVVYQDGLKITAP